MGARLIRAAEEELRGRGLALYAALIEQQNHVSLRLFERGGYRPFNGVVYLSKRESPVSKLALALIGYPFCCGRSRGMPRAVSALRQAGIVERLALDDQGDLALQLPQGPGEGDPRAKNLSLVVQAVQRLGERLSRVEGWPLILGGDCTVILGPARVWADRFPNLGVIYLDAHGDYNTPETSPSGFIDGMCLASATGLGPRPLTEGARLTPERILLYGGRDFDPGEMELIRSSGVNLMDMAAIHREGIATSAQRSLEVLGQRPILLHIDLDVLDPSALPAVDVPTPGGLSWGELEEAAGIWAREGQIVGLEVTAYNPLKDPQGNWTRPIIDLVASIIRSIRR